MKFSKLASLATSALVLSFAPGCLIHVDSDGGWSSSAMWSDGDGPVMHGSGVRTTQAREVGEFHAIELRGCADVRARIGSERTLSVSTDDNLVDKVRTEVRDGTLFIDLERGSYSFRSGVVVDVTVPSLDRLAISGSGDASIDGLAQDKLEISVSGSGDVCGTGKVETLDADVSGSGDLDLQHIVAHTATVSISGSGDIHVQATERLDANISGSGDVTYRGDPRVHSSVSGSGDVERD
jgi:hypothetical protein